jgi:putative phosphoribosyl transferase
MTIFDSITERFQIRFKDRESSGNILGEALKDLIKKQDKQNCLVLGIPRGGVITAYCIASKLGCQFDIIISRKLRAPHNEEMAIGAITGDGTTYLNDSLVKALEISSDYIAKEKLQQIKEIERRLSLYCYNKKTKTGFDQIELDNKIVILADDGTATGATFIAAARCIKSSGNIHRIIIATPIAPKGTLAILKSEGIDHVEVITSPPNSLFKSVEDYYQDFHQVTDYEVIEILERFNHPKNLKN